jgi:hypothetical protein
MWAALSSTPGVLFIENSTVDTAMPKAGLMTFRGLKGGAVSDFELVLIGLLMLSVSINVGLIRRETRRWRRVWRLTGRE